MGQECWTPGVNLHFRVRDLWSLPATLKQDVRKRSKPTFFANFSKRL